MLSVLATILGLSFLVIVHEAGHYLAARAFGMRVTRVSIGFGPAVVSHKPKNSPTTWQIGALPILAYVMIAGMNPAEDVDPKDPGLFSNKSVFARFVTIFAGSFANYLAASLMLFGLAMFAWHEEVPTEPMVIAAVEEGMPAAVAGLKAGDVVLEAEGKSIKNVQALIEVTKTRAGKPTTYVIERDGKRLPPFTITPANKGDRGVIGVAPMTKSIARTMPIGEAAYTALVLPYRLAADNLAGIAKLIRERTTEGITGPVGMGKIVAAQAERGIVPFMNTLIMISIALAVANLLPFPALDGGKLVFLGYELITRKRPNEAFEMTVHAVGILFLLCVMALVTLRDLIS
jgi:regulator of sigma E protease